MHEAVGLITSKQVPLLLFKFGVAGRLEPQFPVGVGFHGLFFTSPLARFGPSPLNRKARRLAAHDKQLEKVRAEMRKVYQLCQTDQISPEGFGKLYRPLEDQERSLAAELPKLQGQVDALEIHQSAADDMVAEASTLHTRWPTFSREEKRRIIESITEKIVVKGDEIDITLAYMPSSEELTKRQRNLSDS